MAGIDFTYDSQHSLVLQGFDVIVEPSAVDSSYVQVTLIEQGSEVWVGDIPLPDNQQELASATLLEDVSQAAIDIFEAERGTLGMGAGAQVPEEQGANVMAAKKAFCYEVNKHEEWYLSFKGTQFEDMAFTLLEDLYALELEHDTIEDTSSALYAELTDIEHQLKMLNIQRLREIPAGAQVIIIKACNFKRHACFGNHAEVQLFVDSFAGSALEPEVLKLVNRYLDVRQEINKRDESFDAFWEANQAIENQMESLSLEALQRNVIEKIPTEGIGAFPEMAADMAELMEGVSIDEPLCEMPMPDMMPFEPVRASYKLAEEEKREVEELGKGHLGLDSAEVPKEDLLPFQEGDKVELSKDLDSFTAGGAPFKIQKGTKGLVHNEFDGHGNSFVVCFEDGSLLNVPETSLKKIS